MELFVYCLASYLSVALADKVLSFYVWDVALVAWNMLRLNVVSGTSDPVGASFRDVADWKLFSFFVLLRRF